MRSDGASLMVASGTAVPLVYIIPYQAPLRTQINPRPLRAAFVRRSWFKRSGSAAKNSAIMPGIMIVATKQSPQKSARLSTKAKSRADDMTASAFGHDPHAHRSEHHERHDRRDDIERGCDVKHGMPASRRVGENVGKRYQQRSSALRGVEHPVIRGRELPAVNVGA